MCHFSESVGEQHWPGMEKTSNGTVSGLLLVPGETAGFLLVSGVSHGKDGTEGSAFGKM